MGVETHDSGLAISCVEECPCKNTKQVYDVF